MKIIGYIPHILNAIKGIMKSLEPFKPNVNSITINYKNCNSIIEVVVHVPEGVRRRFSKIVLPYPGFRIKEMRDKTFRRVESLWTYDGGKWVLPTSKLPSSSERFLIVLEGSIPSDFIKHIVRIQPASNRDQTEEEDRYWLSCMLRNVAVLEELWNYLEIDDVTIDVKVGIKRCFITALPKEVKRALEVAREWLIVGRGRDRAAIYRTWRKYRGVMRSSPSIDRLLEVLYHVTTGSYFRDFVYVDDPFTIGEIKREEVATTPYPERISVEALTNLNIEKPEAKGYLVFKRKRYIESIKNELGVIE